MSWFEEAALDRERWGELVDPVFERIASAEGRNRLPQALLLVGPPGLGRELVAVETAVLVTCEESAEPWSSSGCADRVRRGLHPDVEAVMPQPPSQLIRIDQVRQVVESASGRPYEGRCRVWIFDGVEAGRFGPEAANAFLKTLEEPPEHVRFVLLAANPSAVLPTILSRCQLLSLPGSAAVARKLGADVPSELATMALAGDEFAEMTDQIREALEAALAGDPDVLLRLLRLGGDGGPTMELVAAEAIIMAGEEDRADRTSELVDLASELLETDRRVRALNLNAARQLNSSLLRWYRDLR
jgi:replication-associated recombination protein RarA